MRTGEPAEGGARRQRGGEVQPAGHAGGPGQQRGRQQRPAVQHDLQAGVALAVGDRQHRHAGLGVLVDAAQRQRPEVRRRPHEDDQEQQQRLEVDRAGHRGPAQHRRHGARGAADDDVLRGARLEREGVDEGVADEGRERQQRRQGVGVQLQQRQAGGQQRQGKSGGGREADAAGRGRAAGGALHAAVDVPLEQAVGDRRAQRGEADAGGRGDQAQRRETALAQRQGAGHAGQRGEDDQRDDLGLGQAPVLRPGGRRVQDRAAHDAVCRGAALAGSQAANHATSKAAPVLWNSEAASGRAFITM